MTSEKDRQKELEHRERILREREVELRLREMETDIHATDAAFHQTVKHQPENTQKPWMKKLILGGKLFALGVVALVAVRIASVLAGLVGFLQADQARKELVKTAKKELVKHLPQVAREQSQVVYNAVKECFDSYEREVSKRINDDIVSRKSELDNLVKQKQTREINREGEFNRLKNLQEDVIAQLQKIEAAYSNLLAYYS